MRIPLRQLLPALTLIAAQLLAITALLVLYLRWVRVV